MCHYKGEKKTEKFEKSFLIKTQQVNIKGYYPLFYAPAPKRYS